MTVTSHQMTIRLVFFLTVIHLPVPFVSHKSKANETAATQEVTDLTSSTRLFISLTNLWFSCSNCTQNGKRLSSVAPLNQTELSRLLLLLLSCLVTVVGDVQVAAPSGSPRGRARPPLLHLRPTSCQSCPGPPTRSSLQETKQTRAVISLRKSVCKSL